MLPEILTTLNLPDDFWADLIPCSVSQLQEWRTGQRTVPYSVAERISKAIGIPASSVLATDAVTPVAIPAVWLKARDYELTVDVHRAIALTRLIASGYDELGTLLARQTNEYSQLFYEIRKSVSPSDPPARQGERAAAAFLSFTGLSHGATGIGEALRPRLRSAGVLLLETPIDLRPLEGFCFSVAPGSRPCLIVNSYRSTWFRRNAVLLHELCHAIFDLDSAGAIFEVGPSEDVTSESEDSRQSSEKRAEAFAMHALIPIRLLVAFENRGLKLQGLSADDMARLMSETHAERSLIAKAAEHHGFVDSSERHRLERLEVAEPLKHYSTHARNLYELSANQVYRLDILETSKRKTTFPIRGHRLPVQFVELVLEALQQGKISLGKAAELLMMRKQDLEKRFGLAPQYESVSVA